MGDETLWFIYESMTGLKLRFQLNNAEKFNYFSVTEYKRKNVVK
jgi:hypothetical protein